MRLMKVLEPMLVGLQQRREYSLGEVVFHQGQLADHFYIVNSGELEMSVTTAQGQPVRVKRLKAGDHFGYDVFLSDKHDSTVTCLTPVEVTAVPRHELRLASKDDDYLSSTLVRDGSKEDEERVQEMKVESTRRLNKIGFPVHKDGDAAGVPRW